MSGRSSRDRKRIIRGADGSLYDDDEGRPISIAELSDHLRDVGYFECRRASTGGDCTYEVLQEIYQLHGRRASVAPAPPLTPFGVLGALAGFPGDTGKTAADHESRAD